MGFKEDLKEILAGLKDTKIKGEKTLWKVKK